MAKNSKTVKRFCCHKRSLGNCFFPPHCRCLSCTSFFFFSFIFFSLSIFCFSLLQPFYRIRGSFFFLFLG